MDDDTLQIGAGPCGRRPEALRRIENHVGIDDLSRPDHAAVEKHGFGERRADPHREHAGGEFVVGVGERDEVHSVESLSVRLGSRPAVGHRHLGARDRRERGDSVLDRREIASVTDRRRAFLVDHVGEREIRRVPVLDVARALEVVDAPVSVRVVARRVLARARVGVVGDAVLVGVRHDGYWIGLQVVELIGFGDGVGLVDDDAEVDAPGRSRPGNEQAVREVHIDLRSGGEPVHGGTGEPGDLIEIGHKKVVVRRDRRVGGYVKPDIERSCDVISTRVADPHNDAAHRSAEKGAVGHRKGHHLQIDVALRGARPGKDGHRPGHRENDGKNHGLDAKSSNHFILLYDR